MRSFQAFVFSVLVCGIATQPAQAQGAMIEVVPWEVGVGYMAAISFKRSPLLFALHQPPFDPDDIRPASVAAILAYRFAAAARVSNKIYVGGQHEFGFQVVKDVGSELWGLIGSFVYYYPWASGEFTQWGDKLHFIGGLNYAHTFGSDALNPQLGVGYDLRMGKRKGFAISPQLLYDSFYSLGNGNAQAVIFNVRWKHFTGKARLPKFPAK